MSIITFRINNFCSTILSYFLMKIHNIIFFIYHWSYNIKNHRKIPIFNYKNEKLPSPTTTKARPGRTPAPPACTLQNLVSHLSTRPPVTLCLYAAFTLSFPIPILPQCWQTGQRLSTLLSPATVAAETRRGEHVRASICPAQILCRPCRRWGRRAGWPPAASLCTG